MTRESGFLTKNSKLITIDHESGYFIKVRETRRLNFRLKIAKGFILEGLGDKSENYTSKSDKIPRQTSAFELTHVAVLVLWPFLQVDHFDQLDQICPDGF